MKFDFSARWPETAFLALLIIGFVSALMTRNPILNYFTIFIAGIMIGKLFLIKRFTRSFFFYVVIGGFIFGYLFGSFNANRVVSLLFLTFGVLIGIYIIKRIKIE